MNKKASIFIVLLTFSTFCIAAEPSKLDDASRSLKGLSTVSIRIDSLSEDALRYGLRVEELALMVKRVLDSSEIKVISDKDRPNEPGKTYLFVVVSLMANDSANTCALNLELSLWQQGKLVRDDKIEPINVRTWHVRSLTLIQPGLSLPAVQSKLTENVTAFIKEWCEANGKKLPKAKKKASV